MMSRGSKKSSTGRSKSAIYPFLRFVECTEAVVQSCFLKKVFLKISQNLKHLKNPFFYRTPTAAVFEYIQVVIRSRNPDMATIVDAGTNGSFIKTEHNFNKKKLYRTNQAPIFLENILMIETR